MQTRTSIVLLALPIWLGACSSVDTRPMVDGDPVTAVVLDRKLSIRAGSAHTLFQQGRQVGGVNHFDPYCKFEVDKVFEQPQTVEPGRFEIGRISQRILVDDVTGIPVILAGDRGCDDPLYFETSLRLHAPEQPNARALICLNVGINCSSGYRFLDAQEMKSILGPTFSWEVAGDRQDR